MKRARSHTDQIKRGSQEEQHIAKLKETYSSAMESQPQRLSKFEIMDEIKQVQLEYKKRVNAKFQYLQDHDQDPKIFKCQQGHIGCREVFCESMRPLIAKMRE